MTPPNQSISAGAHLQLCGRVRAQVVDARSKRVVRDQGWQKNLILNQGLDMIASNVIEKCMSVAVAGTGVTPTADDSGTTQASQAGTTVTLAGGGFTLTNTVTDAGKMIKWDTGEEARIVTVTDATHCEVADSKTVASAEFTVYRTNQTGLATEVKRSNTYLSGAGNCGSTLVGDVVTHRRTFDFSAETGSLSYTEVGFSNTTTVAANLFSRIKLNSPVDLTDGQALRLIYDLSVTVAPTTPQAKTASITGWPVAPSTLLTGVEQLQKLGLHRVDTNGNGSGYDGAYRSGWVNEPSFYFNNEEGYSNTCQIFLSPSSAAPSAFDAFPTDRSTNAAAKSVTLSSYVSLSCYLDKTATFGVGEANRSDFRSMGVGVFSGAGSTNPTQRGMGMVPTSRAPRKCATSSRA